MPGLGRLSDSVVGLAGISTCHTVRLWKIWRPKPHALNAEVWPLKLHHAGGGGGSGVRIANGRHCLKKGVSSMLAQGSIGL